MKQAFPITITALAGILVGWIANSHLSNRYDLHRESDGDYIRFDRRTGQMWELIEWKWYKVTEEAKQ
jgi:hypothetical protein